MLFVSEEVVSESEKDEREDKLCSEDDNCFDVENKPSSLPGGSLTSFVHFLFILTPLQQGEEGDEEAAARLIDCGVLKGFRTFTFISSFLCAVSSFCSFSISFRRLIFLL